MMCPFSTKAGAQFRVRPPFIITFMCCFVLPLACVSLTELFFFFNQQQMASGN